MTTHLKVDSSPSGTSKTAPLVAVIPLAPALTDIPGAILYLGKPSRSKFYEDLLPHLDVVRFGARTFITLASLNRLIVANLRAAPSGRSSPDAKNAELSRPARPAALVVASSDESRRQR